MMQNRMFHLGVMLTTTSIDCCLIEGGPPFSWVSGWRHHINANSIVDLETTDFKTLLSSFQQWIQRYVTSQDTIVCRLCYGDSRAFQRLEMASELSSARVFLKEKAQQCFADDMQAVLTDLWMTQIFQVPFVHYLLMKGKDAEVLWQTASKLGVTCSGITTHSLALLRSFLFVFPQKKSLYVLESQQRFHFYVLAQGQLIFCSDFLFEPEMQDPKVFQRLKRRFYLLYESVLALHPQLLLVEDAFYFFGIEKTTEKESALFAALPECKWTLLQPSQLAIDISQEDALVAKKMMPAVGAALGAFEKGPNFPAFARPYTTQHRDGSWKKSLIVSLVLLIICVFLSWILSLGKENKTPELREKDFHHKTASLTKKYQELQAKKQALGQPVSTRYSLLFDLLMETLPEQMALTSLEVNDQSEVLIAAYSRESAAPHHFFAALEAHVLGLELLAIEAKEEGGELRHYVEFKFQLKP